jgi:2',3'-cyclic-nucleotide 2'-phosphodiesterase (5'-nucleotidase family)
MKTRGASAFLWEQPLPVARRIAAELRPQVDLVVALTHIGYRFDVELALSQEVIDVIFGGHSHSFLESPELHGKTYVCQGGSHGRWAGSYEWDGSRLAGELIPLK